MERTLQTIDSPIQILVEGNDARNFFEALTAKRLRVGLQIQDYGGVDELRSFLPAFVKMPEFSAVTSIGIVRDAESSASDAFKSVQGSLGNAGLSVPSDPGQRVGDHPGVTVLILPDNDAPGMLETLLCKTFANDPTNACIDAFFECVERIVETSVKRPDKARAHAYLATKPDPHVSVGVAAQKGYWNLDHTCLAPLHEFLDTVAGA